MPVTSKAQNRWAHANADKPGRTGDVAREFVSASHGMSLKKLPERKKPAAAPAKKIRLFGSLAP